MGPDLALRTFVEDGRYATEQIRVPQIQILTFELFLCVVIITFSLETTCFLVALSDLTCGWKFHFRAGAWSFQQRGERGLCNNELERGCGESELKQRNDTKSRTQQDTNKTRAHLHQISSHVSPETKLPVCIRHEPVAVRCQDLFQSASLSRTRSKRIEGTDLEDAARHVRWSPLESTSEEHHTIMLAFASKLVQTI